MTWLAVAAAVLLVVLSRAAHVDLVWVEEAYGLAAASELLRGESLYREVWFDKPPLYAWFYTLCGAQDGWPLRLLGIGWVLLCAGSVYALAQRLWGGTEAILAAFLTCFFLTFWIPSAVMAIAPDLLMVVPHVACVYLCVRRQAFAAGAIAALCVFCNSKGVLVLVVALIWMFPRISPVLAGFAAVQLAGLAVLPVREYWLQVWEWGFRYSSDTFVNSTLREALVRSGGWIWFHASIVAGASIFFVRERNWRFALWVAISAAAIASGLRFFPRYYFQLLPVMALAGARGLNLMGSRARAAALMLLLIPLVRFGPRYVTLALSGPAGWSDVAMMEDSRRVSETLRTYGAPGELLVWGYRPDVFVFSGLPAGTRFLDSQPLTGVLADRHLLVSTPTLPEIARTNRAELKGERPEWIVDGLGPLNRELSIRSFPDLEPWLSSYEEIWRTGMSVIYRLRRGPARDSLVEER